MPKAGKKEYPDGAVLRRLREAHNMSRRQLAELSGISESKIRALEGGQKKSVEEGAALVKLLLEKRRHL